MAERVLDDVGLNSCRCLRGFLLLYLTPCIHCERGVAIARSRFVGALLTIMRNRVMRLSTMRDAISDVSEDGLRGCLWSVRLIPLACARLFGKVEFEPVRRDIRRFHQKLGRVSRYSRLELDRLRKVEQLREKGIDPFPARVEQSHSIADAVALFVEREFFLWRRGRQCSGSD